jgi:hypothetical protein
VRNAVATNALIVATTDSTLIELFAVLLAITADTVIVASTDTALVDDGQTVWYTVAAEALVVSTTNAALVGLALRAHDLARIGTSTHAAHVVDFSRVGFHVAADAPVRASTFVAQIPFRFAVVHAGAVLARE